MRAAPTGRTHSKRKQAKRYLRKVTRYFKWHRAFVNRYNITKFKWLNTSVTFRHNRSNVNAFNTAAVNDDKQENWFKRLINKFMNVKKKDQPLVIVGIKHYNNKTYSPSVKIQYLKKNHWNTVMISNRTNKLKTIESHNFTEKYNSIIQGKTVENDHVDHFNSLNQIEKSQALRSILPDKNLDIKYDYYYGTNALKTICIPLISGSTESTSSNEVIEFNKTFSLKLDSKLLKGVDSNVEFSNNSHIRKRISQKYASVRSRREANFKTREGVRSDGSVNETKQQFEIIEEPNVKPSIFDPFDKSISNQSR